MTKYYMSWEEFDFAISNIAAQITKSGIKFEGIHGVPRGGLIAAVALSHELNIPFVKNVYHNLTNILIVDDISDSGETLQRYQIWKTATICYKPTSLVIPDYSYVDITDNAWWVFPWEKKDSETIADYKK